MLRTGASAKDGAATILAYHPRIVISVEEGPEDPAEIHAAVMSIARSYHFRPGPCKFGDDEIRNDTIFFEQALRADRAAADIAPGGAKLS